MYSFCSTSQNWNSTTSTSTTASTPAPICTTSILDESRPVMPLAQNDLELLRSLLVISDQHDQNNHTTRNGVGSDRDQQMLTELRQLQIGTESRSLDMFRHMSSPEQQVLTNIGVEGIATSPTQPSTGLVQTQTVDRAEQDRIKGDVSNHLNNIFLPPILGDPQLVPELQKEEYCTDNFRMYGFKIQMCTNEQEHDWMGCPFGHPGEKACRRSPRKYNYAGTACPEFRKGFCKRGDACGYAHGVFECWLHPSRLGSDGKLLPFGLIRFLPASS